MKVLIACKRGNVSERDKWGHCLCSDCKAYNYSVQKISRKDYQKEWRKINKDKCAAYTKKWNDNNKTQRREIEKSWRERNSDNVKRMNSKGGKKWATNNKGKRNSISRKRVLSLLNRTPKWADLKKIEAFYIEAETITKQTGIPHEVDHIVPLQGEFVSGLHVHNNLQILTRFHNRSKRNKCVCS